MQLGTPLRPSSLHHQAGPLGETSFKLGLPKGLFLDEQGGSVQQLEVAPTDVLAVLIGLGAASLDVAAGHQNYTFNNLIACLICCDILQVLRLGKQLALLHQSHGNKISHGHPHTNPLSKAYG